MHVMSAARWSLGEAGAVANHSVEFSNGARDVLGARERPHLLFDASGHPIALTNGVCPHGNAWNDASASRRDDFSYTLLQPLVSAEPSSASSSEPPRSPPSEEPASAPALPGLADVCGHLAPAERCSPEICDLKPHATVRLAAKTYYQNASIQLPDGAVVVGAGINRTFVISCGAPSNGRNPARRGFILGNHSYLGGFTWQGLQASRGNFDAAVGTPGCRHPNHAHPGAPCQAGCIPEGGDCAGVKNATVEHIHVRPFSSGDDWWPLTSSAGWFPVTKPWGDDRRTGSYNLTIRGLISWGSWADGIVSTWARRSMHQGCLLNLIPSFAHFFPIFPHLSPIFTVWTPGIQGTRPNAQGKTGSWKIGVVKSLGAPGSALQTTTLFLAGPWLRVHTRWRCVSEPARRAPQRPRGGL